MKPFGIVETDLQFGDLSQRSETSMLVVHHVGGTNRDVAAEEIHGWHKNQGWAGIGYHYVIRKDGAIERGRPEFAIGSHAYGYNDRSVGINVVGEFGAAVPEPEQVESLAQLIADLCSRHGIDTSAVVGHRDLMETDCPGGNLYAMLPEIRGKAIWYMENGLNA